MQLSAVSGLILWDQFYGSSQFPGSSVRLVLAPRGTILTSGWTVQNGVTSKMEIDCLGRRTQIHNYLRQEDREHSRQDDVQYRQRSTMRDEGHGRLFLETNADVSSRRAGTAESSSDIDLRISGELTDTERLFHLRGQLQL